LNDYVVYAAAMPRDKFQSCHWPLLALRALRKILRNQFSLRYVAYLACEGWKPA